MPNTVKLGRRFIAEADDVTIERKPTTPPQGPSTTPPVAPKSGPPPAP